MCLKNEGVCRLVKEAPEDGNKEKEWGKFANGGESLTAEELLAKGISVRRDVDKFATPHPESEGGNGHQNAGGAKCPVWTIPFENKGDGKVGDDRAEVDGEVEDIEDFGDEVLVVFAELITHVGRDAGLDAASANGNEAQAGKQPEAAPCLPCP